MGYASVKGAVAVWVALSRRVRYHPRAVRVGAMHAATGLLRAITPHAARKTGSEVERSRLFGDAATLLTIW
jgi:hypothetical protein